MATTEPQQSTEGIPDSEYPGPYPVGSYAAQLRRRLREFAKVQLVGEVFGFKPGRARVYFELRDAYGALPCSMWTTDFEQLAIPLQDGMRVVAGGGCDYYAGSRSSSPSFTFDVTELRIAGEGDLLVELERLRKRLAADGLFEPQKRLPRPTLPRTIGVVTGERGKARDDIIAGLKRRGWAGRLVWAFVPVQDRHAAPRISAALRELAAQPEIEVIIVARGGGSLADLFAFCDEALCRTVALLRVPVISSVGHHTDRPLIDDVAAVVCSTPTHAAEAAVPIDIAQARGATVGHARRLHTHSRRAVLHRARELAQLSRAPTEQIARHRRRLHQLLRELRASGRRRPQRERQRTTAHATAVDRSAARALGSDQGKRRSELERLTLALAAHDPARTLARGYAMVRDDAGEPLSTADAATRAKDLVLSFADGDVPATVKPQK